MVAVYDLRKDSSRIEAFQHLSRIKSPHGIIPEHGLIGSGEWWSAVSAGTLETRAVEGTISRVYFGGHSTSFDGRSGADFPMFEIDDGSSRTQLQRVGDDAHFVVGGPIRVDCVFGRSFRGDSKPIILKIWIRNDDSG